MNVEYAERRFVCERINPRSLNSRRIGLLLSPEHGRILRDLVCGSILLLVLVRLSKRFQPLVGSFCAATPAATSAIQLDILTAGLVGFRAMQGGCEHYKATAFAFPHTPAKLLVG